MDNINFLTPAQTMDALNISYPTLIRRVKNNSIPYIRIGKALRFPRSYFEQLEREAMKSTGRARIDD